jgi:hypothetical protein
VAREDMVMMRRKELVRWHLIQKVRAGELTQRDAARMLRVSERQVRRWVRRVAEEGERGVIHRSRGRRSNGVRGGAPGKVVALPGQYGVWADVVRREAGARGGWGGRRSGDGRRRGMGRFTYPGIIGGERKH